MLGSKRARAPRGPLPDKVFSLAIGLVVVAATFNAIDTLLVRVISTEMSAFSIGFFRAAFGLLFVAPWVIRRRANIFKTNFRWLHVGRAGLKALSLAAFFYAISRANLAQVTAIAFTTPVFVIVGAVLILGEKLGIARILSVLLGFVGVLLIVRPFAGQFDPYLLFALAGAIATAAIQLMLKAMSERDSTDTLVAWNLLLMVPLSLLPALFFWTTPSLLMLGLLAVQGALGAVAMTAITRAVSLADVSAIIPFDFLRLPLVAVGASYFFGQSADAMTWAGAAAIFLAGVLASRRIGRTVAPVPAAGAGAADITEVDVVEGARGEKTPNDEQRPKKG
jgi:drug/metabolite transporter (DMT)-like permease